MEKSGFRGMAHLLGGHASTEEGGGGEVAAVAGVSSAHHVLGVPHLLSQLGHAARNAMGRQNERWVNLSALLSHHDHWSPDT